MAEEEKAEQAQAKVGIVKKLVTVGLIVLVPAIAGLGTFMFVLRPMFAEPETVENDSGKIPPTTVMPARLGPGRGVGAILACAAAVFSRAGLCQPEDRPVGRKLEPNVRGHTR